MLAEGFNGSSQLTKKKTTSKAKQSTPKMGRPELGELKRNIVLAQIVVNQQEADIIRRRAAEAGLQWQWFLRELGIK